MRKKFKMRLRSVCMTNQQWAAIRAVAKRQDITGAELVRRLIAAHLAAQPETVSK